MIVSADPSKRRAARNNSDNCFKICIGWNPNHQKSYYKVLHYARDQDSNFGERYIAADRPENLTLRPPVNLETLGTYIGEWNVNTMKFEGYGRIKYPAQFSGFYQYGQFENQKLVNQGKRWFLTDFLKNYSGCQEGEFLDG